jgi:hypothetical protein
VPKSKGCTKLSLSVFMRDSPHINTMACYCCYSRRQPLAPPTPLLLAPLRPVSSLSPPVPSALVMIVSSRTPPPPCRSCLPLRQPEAYLALLPHPHLIQFNFPCVFCAARADLPAPPCSHLLQPLPRGNRHCSVAAKISCTLSFSSFSDPLASSFVSSFPFLSSPVPQTTGHPRSPVALTLFLRCIVMS